MVTLLIFNIIHRRKHHSVVGSRLGATGQACGSQLGYHQDASSKSSRLGGDKTGVERVTRCRQDASLESLRYSVSPTLPLAARWGQMSPL